MGKNQNVGHKHNKQILKIAERNGARIVSGKKHILIFDGPDLVLSLSRGAHRSDSVPGGMMKVALKRMKARGWDVGNG